MKSSQIYAVFPLTDSILQSKSVFFYRSDKKAAFFARTVSFLAVFDRESAPFGKNIIVFCPNDGQRISPVSLSKHMTEEGWSYITRQRRILASLMCQTLYSSSASLTFSCLVRVYTEIFPKCSRTMASTFVHNSISDI